MLVEKNQDTTDLTEGFGSPTGTEAYHQDFPPYIYYTDGVAEMCQNLKSFWVIGIVGSYQHTEPYKSTPTQVWHFYAKGGKATAYCDGKFVQDFTFTTLPDGVITLNGGWWLEDKKKSSLIALPVEG